MKKAATSPRKFSAQFPERNKVLVDKRYSRSREFKYENENEDRTNTNPEYKINGSLSCQNKKKKWQWVKGQRPMKKELASNVFYASVCFFFISLLYITPLMPSAFFARVHTHTRLPQCRNVNTVMYHVCIVFFSVFFFFLILLNETMTKRGKRRGSDQVNGRMEGNERPRKCDAIYLYYVLVVN